MFELRHLAALDAIASAGSFGKAATALGYSQSTLSQQVASLEKAVGGKLFDRTGGPRPAQLTPLGRLVLEHGRDLLAAAEAVSDAIDRFQAGSGRVDIGTFQTVTNTLLPRVVRQLRDVHPDCEIKLFEDDAEVPQLEGLDVLFVDGPAPPDVDSTLILRDSLVLLAAAGDLEPGPVDITRLNGAAMVAQPPICDQRRVEAALDAMGVFPQFVFRTADNTAVVSMVNAGLGWAIMPWLAVSTLLPSTVTTHPLTPALEPREIHALSAGTMSPLAVKVVELTQLAARDAARDAPAGMIRLRARR
ncbi:LysR family transcriptional regulator [Mycolicibacterium arenosum]|uniref:LysR family transcriptional regulator n=1 Tax=Mycolicibacterium arenosum TaxID=2952157 RepID=A0ABT1M6J3_9MYCO|nr:LysR family transcriptional regulator [Mycolicibacterium sp. CAU 1645]MCP9274780.1 LysR family transcriptional regulator [Mycolicibacterium sp. CAU 1645]